jgi:nucleolar GTP-binding protein
MSVKATACDILLRQRVDMKMKSRKLDGVLNRMQITLPSKRDTKTRISSIPASVLAARQRKKAEKEGALTSDTKNADSMETEEDVPTRKLLRDIEREQGGVGVFHFDLRKHWRLSDDAATNASWQTHDAPEIYLGKNVADFYAEDIADRLEALEREEEELIAQTEMEMDSSEGHALTPEQQALWQKISDKKKVIMQSSRVSKSRNKPRITSRTRERDHDNMTEHLVELGLPGVDEEKTRGRKRKRVSLSRGGDGMDVDGEEGARSRSKSHAPRDKTPHESGFRDKRQKLEAKKLMKKSAKLMNRRGMQGVADRFIGTKMPKHLFSGKRGIGKTDWR